MSKHAAVYVPGIGDHKPYFQPQILKLWNLFGVKAYFHPVIWRSAEPLEDKLDKLTHKIDELSFKYDKVSLVGMSAGASAALNAYMVRKNKIHRVVYICGKLKRPESIGEAYYRRNPAFKESMLLAQTNINKLDKFDKAKMLSMAPLHDETVPVKDTKINGVRNFRMFSAYHIPSIFAAISIYSPALCKFLRSNQ
jgi:hypothetical protein